MKKLNIWQRDALNVNVVHRPIYRVSHDERHRLTGQNQNQNLHLLVRKKN